MKHKAKALALGLAMLVLGAALLTGCGKSKNTYSAIVVANDDYLAVDIKENSTGGSLGLHYIYADDSTKVKDENGKATDIMALEAGMYLDIVEYYEGNARTMQYPPSFVAASIKVTGTGAQREEYAEALDNLNSLRTIQMEVYFLEDGQLKSEAVTGISSSRHVIELWKEYNGFESLTLLDYTLEDNSTTETTGEGDTAAVVHTMGDTAYLTLDFTEEIVVYAEEVGEAERALLMESLAKTFVSGRYSYSTVELTVTTEGIHVYTGSFSTEGFAGGLSGVEVQPG